MEFLARRYDNGNGVRIRMDGHRIAHCRHAAIPDGKPVAWVAPGFFDIQVNGYGGQEFSSRELTPEKVVEMVRQHDRFGVVRICPTLTTESFDVLAHGMRAIAAAAESSPEMGRMIAGIHLEGPYFSTEEGPRGAHPAEHCRRPDWDEFQRLQQSAAGRIVLLTLSPEFDEAADFIARVVRSGVVVAVGHTGADAAHLQAAVDAGASLSTHLGNGAHRMLRRHPNYIWDKLADDRLMASLIVDGHHLPPEVVQTFVRAKSPERCVLISDLSGLAGLPPGRYPSSGCELEILPDGRLVIAGQDQLLAGASRPIGVGVANVMRMAGVDLRQAVDMATRHPDRLLGEVQRGLRPGDPADLVLFDLKRAIDGVVSSLDVLATFRGGQLVYGGVPSG